MAQPSYWTNYTESKQRRRKLASTHVFTPEEQAAFAAKRKAQQERINTVAPEAPTQTRVKRDTRMYYRTQLDSLSDRWLTENGQHKEPGGHRPHSKRHAKHSPEISLPTTHRLEGSPLADA